jgi:hypothetical protein
LAPEPSRARPRCDVRDGSAAIPVRVVGGSPWAPMTDVEHEKTSSAASIGSGKQWGLAGRSEAERSPAGRKAGRTGFRRDPRLGSPPVVGRSGGAHESCGDDD